jgi:hypothetical protein
MDQLLRERACAPDASVPTVKAQSSVSPYKGKKSGAFQKNEIFGEISDLSAKGALHW